MPYSIPDEEQIRDALKIVMRRRKGIGSLRKLREQVIKELKVEDPEFTVSPERLRKIAANTEFIKIQIDARQGTKRNLKGKCPVCNGRLKMTKNETIFGGTVTLGYRCVNCPYWTTLKRRIPTRYRFEYEKDVKEE
ncbi:MAG: hypothetical protein ACOC85_00880 [Thermoplasmatota archaeon]